MFDDPQSFLIVLLASALAPVLAGLVTQRWRTLVAPVVVIELLLGVLVGPQVLGLAEPSDILKVFSQLGLGFLFFFAGYEIRLGQIKGAPLRMAGRGWMLSMLIAYCAAALLHVSGVVESTLLTGSAMATTAIGTLIPVLSDEKMLGGDFGRQILAIGAVGEFGPVLLITLLLGATESAAEQMVLLVVFLIAAVLMAIAATGVAARYLKFINRFMETSGQLPVRLVVALIFLLAIVAESLGMDVILGAFAAGMIMRMINGDRDTDLFDAKLEAVGYGFLIPFFFVMSGLTLDVNSLFSSGHALLKLATFFVLMLVARGLPVLLLNRRALPRRQLAPMAMLAATQLPLVVAITSIGLDNGNMKPDIAAALVTAAVLTVLIFPSTAIRQLRKGEAEEAAATG